MLNSSLRRTRTSLWMLALLASVTACNKQEEPAAAPESAVTEAPASTAVAYVSTQDAGVDVIDLATMQVTKSLDVKAQGPRGLALTDDGKQLVVATRENGSVSVIDTATGEVVKQIEVGKNPEFVRVHGNYAFVSSEPSAKAGPPPKPGSKPEEDDDDDEEKVPAKIAIVDLTKGEKVREITGGPETEGVEFSADGKQLVITNEADNTVTVHNIETGDLVKTMVGIVREMLRTALDSFARLDVSQTVEVARQDEQVDEQFRAAMRQLITFMLEDPRTISMSLEVLFVAKAIERIGDHAKNISEYVVYMVKGKDIRHTSLEDIQRETQS